MTVDKMITGLSGIAAKCPEISNVKKTRKLDEVIDALLCFDECVRYLNTRRSSGAVLNLTSEAEVQDALYLILRPWVRDLVPESPTSKNTNRFVIQDFLSESLRLIIEAKYIRNKDHGKNVSKEIHDDIEMYRHHPFCDSIVFFIHDPDVLIPDKEALRRRIEEERTYAGKSLTCKLIIKP